MEKTIGYHHFKPLLDQFVRRVQTALGGNVVSVVLYGSVARGEAKPESDVDLLLVLEKASPVYRDRLRPIFPVLRELQAHPCWTALADQGISPSFSVLVLSRDEADRNRSFYLDMIEEARILVDREDFFQRRLNVLRNRLRELGARKVREDGTWYWDLKPDLHLGENIIL